MSVNCMTLAVSLRGPRTQPELLPWPFAGILDGPDNGERGNKGVGWVDDKR